MTISQRLVRPNLIHETILKYLDYELVNTVKSDFYDAIGRVEIAGSVEIIEQLNDDHTYKTPAGTRYL